MINKINPIYTLAFFLTIAIISYIQLENKKTILKKEYAKLEQFENEVNKLQTLKNTWDNKNIQNTIKSIRSLDKSIEYKNYNSKIVLTLNTQDTNLKQKFINKILNSNLKIDKFDIKKEIIVFEIGNK